MKYIIIDDDETARLVIQKLSSKSEKLSFVEEFSSAIEAIKFLHNNTVDLIFLDIHMPSFSGMDFIKTLKDAPKIILTSSDKNFALEAFEYENVVDYLLKPISTDRFDKALQKLASFSNSLEKPDYTIQSDSFNYLFVHVDKKLVKINIPDIYLIEAKGDYISIKTDKKNYIVHATLKKIEEKIPANIFLRIHRSFIINTNEIIDIQDNSVLIKKSVVPISRTYKSILLKKLNLL